MTREATRDDLPTLLAIQSVSLESTWPDLLHAGIDGPPLVLVVGRPPVGYALVVPGDPAYLAELAVAPDHRGSGHGSTLLAAVVDRVGESDLRLTARADATRVRRFYERHGFAVVERLAGHYDGDDGLLLVRQPDADPSSASESASDASAVESASDSSSDSGRS